MSLTLYNKKRNFKDTPEPSGKPAKSRSKLRFVVQRHKASHLHYDFRLEMDGVLKSWAVPKGPSLNPTDKRLAMMVEDHPYNYRTFTGIIPEGNYGAGIVEIWDEGDLSDLDNSDKATAEKKLKAGLKSGNLKFHLYGKKLKGEFALVKLKNDKASDSNSWLLIKHNDAHAVHEAYSSEEHTPKSSPINKWLETHGSKGARAKSQEAGTKHKVERTKKAGLKKASKSEGTGKQKAKKTASKDDEGDAGIVSKPSGRSRYLPAETRKLSHYITPMLAKETDTPFDDEGWIYEIKWDGYRAIAEVSDDDIRLYSRNGNSFNASYPLIVKALEKIKTPAILDGEVVAVDESGKSRFQLLQHYLSDSNYPLQYRVFDILSLNGEDLYELPLISRKELLKKLLENAGDSNVIFYSDHIEADGKKFFEAAVKQDLEGVMAKKADSLYTPGLRTSEWLKVKHHKTQEAVIAGFTEPTGSRKHFGALILGMYDKGKLKYIGHTGSGFTTQSLADMYKLLKPLIRKESPFGERVKTNMPATWVKPELVCEIKYTEWTQDGHLRHPIFQTLRGDKKPKDVTMNANKPIKKSAIKKTNSSKPEALKIPAKKAITKKTAVKKTTAKKTALKKAVASKTSHSSATSAPPREKNTSSAKKTAKKTTAKKTTSFASPASLREKKTLSAKKVPIGNSISFGKTKVTITHPDKIFFPDVKVTKGDVINYYTSVSKYILPYLKGRPQSLKRNPNGIKDIGFYHKDAGIAAPDWVKSIPVFSESANKDINYILCDDQPTLTYLNNLGCIEINPWHSTVKALNKPDYLIIDLDPSDKNTFDQVIETANVIRELFKKAGVESYCKTSGATGLHIYVPAQKRYTYDQLKDFAHLICVMAQEQLPKFTSLERNLKKRGNKMIYLDHLQNRIGQTISSVYSLRPKPGAPVSMPVKWTEVKPGLSPLDFTIFNALKEIEKRKDLFVPVLGKGLDLEKCLKLLSL